MGIYVEFLLGRPPPKSPDLFVNFEFLAEVKGMSSIKSSKISNSIKEAFEQIAAEWTRYPDDSPKPPVKLLLYRVMIVLRYGFGHFWL